MTDQNYKYWELQFPKLKQLSLDLVTQCICICAKNVDTANKLFPHLLILDDTVIDHCNTWFFVHGTEKQIHELKEFISQVLQVKFKIKERDE
jgi:hypothetical protein